MGDFIIHPKSDGPEEHSEIVLTKTGKLKPQRKAKLITQAVEKLSFMRSLKEESAFILGITENSGEYTINFIQDVTLVSDKNYALIDVKPALHKARLEYCTGVILAHNHPAGDINEPSSEDKNITESTEEYCRSPFLDQNLEKKRLRFYDHIIIMGNRKTLYFSFWEHKMLRPKEDLI